jgi:RNA-binding protein YlmH
MKYLETNKILTNLNHGFRSGYSCESQLLITINDFLKEHDKGHQVDVAILDFSKAFDTVPHNKLLHKLDQYGIKGSIHT